MPTTGNISLYFHLPFCRRKCPYCHFFVVPYSPTAQTALLNALRKEWCLYQSFIQNRTIVSVYFGGGTPYLMGPEAIREILSWIQAPTTAEITLEANPEDVSQESLSAYAAAGINRISLGVQSLDDETLKILGRHHTAQEAEMAVLKVREAGISNISIDLMYEIPSQRYDGWIKTVKQAINLPITHLSLYNLTFEPQTLFFKKRSSLLPLLPSPDESLKMLTSAVEIVEKKLPRYEISAFAIPGYESRHNSGYWEGRPFLGFGPSAFSYWEGKRYRNISHLKKYCDALERGAFPVDFEERLTPLASLHERLAVRLRMLKGVSMADYPVDQSLYQKLEEKGWIKVENNVASLTEEGLLFYDTLAEEIIVVES